MKKFKKNKEKLIIFLISFILLMVLSCFMSLLTMDGVWNYGFSSNIAKNLIPYKDFNMVIGPLYSILISFFLRIFGNTVLVFNFANSIIISIFFVFIFQKMKMKTIYILMFFGFFQVIYGYNTFCAFLVIGILLLSESDLKYKDFYIGLLIGMMVMTKHNIGLVMLFVAFIINKNKLRLIIGASIPVIITCLYLIYNNAFLSYIDFCYLGLGNFLDNFHYDLFSFVVEILIVIWLIKKYIKRKDDRIVYLLAFQIINIPLFDVVHSIPALLPVIYYYFLESNNKKNFLSLEIIIIIGFIEIQILSLPIYYSSNDSVFAYSRVSADFNEYIENISNYISDKQEEHKVYIFKEYSYLIRLYLNQIPNFYDLINKGNLGSNEEKYIIKLEEDCMNKKCMFILDEKYYKKDIYTQLSFEFKKYVLENTYYLETLPSGDRVYVNYEIKPEN